MKKLLAFLSLVGLCFAAEGQTNTNTVSLPITIPGGLNIFTNLPSTSLDLAKVEASAGATLLRSSPENYIHIDWDVASRIQLGGEIYNAPGGVGIDSAAAYLGYRAMVNPNYALTLQVFGRRSWATINSGLITPSWSGGFQADINWRMLSGNNAYWDGAWGVESPTQRGGSFSQYIKAGVKFCF